MTDLSTTIAGVTFPSCFMNAAGALCVTREELLALGRSRAGAIVTKSMTVEPRQGNPEPRYYGFPGGSINSMGLPNLGYRAYAELIPELKRFGKPVIASVAGLCEDDFPTIATAINAAAPDLIEVNLSCPNIPGKPQIGYDPDASERLMKRVRKVITVPMGIKLPPYFDPAHHEAMGKVIGRCGVDFINMINSVGNGLVVDPEREAVVIKPKGGFGGLGGTLIKPVALATSGRSTNFSRGGFRSSARAGWSTAWMPSSIFSAARRLCRSARCWSKTDSRYSAGWKPNWRRT